MHTHHRLSRPAAFLIRRIERYRTSSLAGRADCRFTPTCSHYAEEALRARWLPVAALLIVWRLMRCNPFMHQRVHDPLRRRRRLRLRPNTLPTLFSILALSGFVVVATAGIAAAVGVSNGCSASLNGHDVSTLDQDHALVVHRGDNVRFVGAVPTSVRSAPKDQLISNTHIDVDVVVGLASVSSSDHPGHGPIWGGLENVDKYLGKTVGLYHVKGIATGSPGGWTCKGDAYVKLEDGSPLTKPAGAVAGGLAIVGGLGAFASTRGGKPEPGDASYDDAGGMAPEGESREETFFTPLEERTREAQGKLDPTSDAYATMGCLLALVVATGAALTAKGVAASSVAAAAAGRRGPRRVWAHGHPIAGFFSGLFFGLGLTVLLQQYAVWPLTIVTAIVFPIVTAIACSLRAWLGKAYSFAA